MVNLKSEISLEEENELLQYIVRNDKYHCLHDENFWKEIENQEISKRTWQNLKYHFENKLIHKLKHPSFKLNDGQISKILKASSCAHEIKMVDRTKSTDIRAASAENIGKKIIVISRRKNSINIYPNYRTEGHKRILVSRLSNPTPDLTYPESNPEKPKRTILASLCLGRKKEVFVVKPKEEQSLHGNDDDSERKPPKKLICFCHNVT